MPFGNIIDPATAGRVVSNLVPEGGGPSSELASLDAREQQLVAQLGEINRVLADVRSRKAKLQAGSSRTREPSLEERRDALFAAPAPKKPPRYFVNPDGSLRPMSPAEEADFTARASAPKK